MSTASFIMLWCCHFQLVASMLWVDARMFLSSLDKINFFLLVLVPQTKKKQHKKTQHLIT